VRFNTRVTTRVVLLWAMGLLLVTYLGALALRAMGSSMADNPWFGTVVDDWLGLAAVWAPAGVCWLALSRVGLRRKEVLLVASALTSYAAADSYYTWMLAGAGSVPFPSLADVGYLLDPLLILAALAVAVRNHSRGMASSVWLDCAVGSLGAASVLAVILSPVLASTLTGSWSLVDVGAVAYPMSDILLVAAVAGIAALRGVRMGSRWAVLVLGLVTFAAGDMVYAFQVIANTYVVGTLLDATWPIGLALIAVWVDNTPLRAGSTTQETSVTGATALAVSTAATAAGLGVLVLSSRVHLSTLAVSLAGVALLAAAARSLLAFRLLSQTASLRRQAAATDELTGLPNRRALYAEERARLVEPLHRRQALLMLDLDNFKEVNDSLGHHAGDRLLVQVGARLKEHLRTGDVLARLGGDEFAVLLEDAGVEQAAEVASTLRSALAEPFDVEDIALHTSVSIGIALFPDHGLDVSSLLRRADIAMYKAKTSGRGQHVYSTTDDAAEAVRLQTVDELRTAITNDQLVVHYQPKIDLATGEVNSVEALVRWDHPTRGLLYPDAFLPLVEEAGLMSGLTRVVLGLALDQAAAWRAQGRPLTVAVNLSASSLVDADLPQLVASMLAARGAPPDALQLEVTEEFLMADRDRARAILSRLRHSGVQISVDDFGTGYSSLSYLRDLPIDELKLDRSFVFPMADDARAAALVASTIDLAHSLGLRMVAEGVETQVAYSELAALGCDQAQGYYMSRPVPAAELDHWLTNRRPTGPPANTPEPRPAAALS